MEILLFALLFAIFSALIASHKSRSVLGWFFVGAFFGPFGLLVAAFPKLDPAKNMARKAPQSRSQGCLEQHNAQFRACPHCTKQIPKTTDQCLFCHQSVEPEPINLPKPEAVVEPETEEPTTKETVPAAARLRELESLHTDDLITDEEYESKRAEIMKEL